MKHILTRHPRTFEIATAVAFAPDRPGWVRARHGRAWLTRDHAPCDWILEPGAWHWIEPGHRWVVEALTAPSLSTALLSTSLDWQPHELHGTRAWIAVWQRVTQGRHRGGAPVGC
jgi:hypothetical protein